MRIGQNPAKAAKQVEQAQRITVAVLNYIPFQSGFYAEGLEVLRACLTSARTDPGLPMDLMVFDNGSCAEVQDALVAMHQAEEIQYLLLSEKNLGKGGAWNIIFGGAPGELIAYADSDVLFAPGWLARSVEILEAYPRVGMVTARPFRTPPKFSSATIAWAQNTPEAHFESGQFLSWEDFSSFVFSLGTSEEQARQWYTSGEEDLRTTYAGVNAQIGASHWQFLARKSILQEFLPFSMERPMGQVRQLDEAMNAAGYLRLMIPEPLAQNMSNTLPAALREKGSTRQRKPTRSVWQRFANFPPLRKILLDLYDRIFRLYN